MLQKHPTNFLNTDGAKHPTKFPSMLNAQGSTLNNSPDGDGQTPIDLSITLSGGKVIVFPGSFVSSAFSTLLDIIPSTLDVSYVVKLADGRILEANTVLRGSTLVLLGHPFNIDLIPIELGSFDVIIGMDWLANHHAVIVYDGKIVRIPYGDEFLIVQGVEVERRRSRS
ncbi:putative reverse transcriptase domain-containing protein [Tanacetum coccineum]